MKKLLLTIFLLLVAMKVNVMAQSIWSRVHLEDVRAHLDLPYYANAYTFLVEQADALLGAEPLSVVTKKDAPASGDMHDYMSIARYSWPDPTKPDGLPYINRDGVSNPELKLYDREKLGETAQRIVTLSLAYFFSGEEKYARKATELIRAWFFDKKTFMKPNLRYAQVVKGQNNNLGRSYGVIDSYSFIDMLEAVPLLKTSKSFTAKDSRQLKQWFRELLAWMTTDEEAVKESSASNNHSIAYDAQVISFALYCGEVDLAKKYIQAFAERRIYMQIESSGAQPHELSRTLAYHYSWYNINHIIDVLLMARNLGMDIDRSTSVDGRNFYKAVDFMLPYTGRDAKPWPYKQISGMEESQQHMAMDLYRVYAYLDSSRSDYLEVYNKTRVLNLKDRFILLYFQATSTDHAMAWAEQQLRYSVDVVRKAINDKKNTVVRRVNPRSVNADGSLVMVGCHDWCCGFYPGELWQMYDYTNDVFWRKHALSQSWAIEDLKYHRGTHDLGFMAYCSFGHGYDLIHEKSLEDVVVDASKSLISRYNPTVGCIRSWDHNREYWKYPVIIDNMMNLEMLFRATQITGDSTFWNIAVSHANTTMNNHFRPDASTYHVVDYDPQTGKAVIHQTHQGYSDESFWSRGQGWGLYGYTMCYRFTHDEKYLNLAKRIAAFWMSLSNMPSDGIPYWDMREPTIENCTSEDVVASVPRDASAAALIASALYELSTFVPEKRAEYRKLADKMLDSLSANYRPAIGEACGFLLLHSTGHKPHNSEVDVPLSYADYYYLEALLRRDRMK